MIDDELHEVTISIVGLGIKAQDRFVFTDEMIRQVIDQRLFLVSHLDFRVVSIARLWLDQVMSNPIPPPPERPRFPLTPIEPPRRPVKDFFNRIYLWLAKVVQH